MKAMGLAAEMAMRWANARQKLAFCPFFPRFRALYPTKSTYAKSTACMGV
jgi:hypothetical protein